MPDQTVVLSRLQVKRAIAPGRRPASLEEGEEFINLADRFRLIGDGVTPPDLLPSYPLRPGVNDVSGLPDVLNAKAPLENPQFSGAVRAETLQILGPGSTGDASSLSSTDATAGAVPVRHQDRLTTIAARDFGAMPNTGLDMTAKLNAALKAAFETRRPLVLERGYYGVSQTSVAADGRPYALLSKAVDILGQGANAIDVVIYPLAGTANNVDILRVEAPAGLGENFTLQNFMIDPAVSGTKRGGVGIYMVNLEGGNLSKALIENVRVKPGNDYSLYIKGTPTATTPQGALANSQILRSVFEDGIKGEGVGDSVYWGSNVFRTSSATRAAVDYAVTNLNPDFPGGIANLASIQTFDNCNFGSLGPVVVLHNGRHYVFRNANMEIGNEPNATGGPNGVMVDVRGDVGPVVRVSFEGGHLGLFGATTTATKFFRLDNVQSFHIDGTSLLSGLPSGVAVGFDITANAKDTVLRSFRTNQSTFASLVNDAGVGTMGLKKPLTLAANMTTETGIEAPGFIKDANGSVRLYGTVNVGNTGGAAVIGTLPEGFRPAIGQRNGVVLTAGAATTVDVLTDGRVIFNAAGPQQVPLNGVSFQMDPVVREVVQAR